MESRKYVISKINIFLSMIFGLVFFFLAVFGTFLPQIVGDFSKIPNTIRSETSLGVSYTSSILGFLISGFTLFFALISKDQVNKLIETNTPLKKETIKPISCMRMILYSFMYVFIHYVLFLIFCLSISLLFPEGGPLRYITTYVFSHNESLMKIFCLSLFSFLSGWFIYIVMLLKSFIWNLYQTITLSIALGCQENPE